eukprot:CAMPEP_0170490710 /NCGR_PEP_ID=MMETSP0208-20121228/8813_1 /TAXON_ID=197538 /ORGANISM="Strombidium inclinatum, Strain S3" /LENGTH=67 /DNA_ID=CAMNT_0010766151 /DNA_START=985 /DNA_END=1188 /DNA_ORIENTATION=+
MRKQGGPEDVRSVMSKTVSHISKKSLTKSDLEKFFKDKKAQVDEDIKSRFSRASRHSKTPSKTSSFK